MTVKRVASTAGGCPACPRRGGLIGGTPSWCRCRDHRLKQLLGAALGEARGGRQCAKAGCCTTTAAPHRQLRVKLTNTGSRPSAVDQGRERPRGGGRKLKDDGGRAAHHRRRRHPPPRSGECLHENGHELGSLGLPRRSTTHRAIRQSGAKCPEQTSIFAQNIIADTAQAECHHPDHGPRLRLPHRAGGEYWDWPRQEWLPGIGHKAERWDVRAISCGARAGHRAGRSAEGSWTGRLREHLLSEGAGIGDRHRIRPAARAKDPSATSRSTPSTPASGSQKQFAEKLGAERSWCRIGLLLPLREGEPGGHPPHQVDDRLRRAGPLEGGSGLVGHDEARGRRAPSSSNGSPATRPRRLASGSRGHGAYRSEDRPRRGALGPSVTTGRVTVDAPPRVRTWRRTLRALAPAGRAALQAP